jgi:hypothetical protein
MRLFYQSMATYEAAVKSSIATAMGAKISITGPGRCMYLVIGRSFSPDSLVKTAGGQIVLKINGNKMLVILSFDGYLSLRCNYQISHIGPVNVDIKRLAKVTEMLAKANGTKPSA